MRIAHVHPGSLSRGDKTVAGNWLEREPFSGCLGRAFMMPQSLNRLTAPLLLPLDAEAAFSRPVD
jgi:hypothetical protein